MSPEFPRDGEFREGFPVFSVHNLVRTTHELLSEVFSFVWVRGEISDLRPSRQGHLYFTLKDEHAALPAVMFRGDAFRLGFDLQNGLDVMAGGAPGIYRERGQFQLVVRSLEAAGTGALAQAFADLKRRLEAEGLFDPARKRPLPRLPHRVGVVTSPTGSVIRDILDVSGRRHPGVDILVAPSRVQGEGAEQELAAALAALDERNDIDLVIIARGGGSLEDLWPFNTETVARAVAAMRLPVVSAVGHETDFTICDFAADLRAPTPSAAAELVFPDRAALLQDADREARRLQRAATLQLERHRAWLAARMPRLRHPRERLEQLMLRLDERQRRLDLAMDRRLEAARWRLAGQAARLDSLSPLAVLSRGYGLVTDPEGRPRTRVRDMRAGESLLLHMVDGRIETEIRSVHPERRKAKQT